MKWSVWRRNVCVRLAVRMESEKKPLALIRTVQAVAGVARITHVTFLSFHQSPHPIRVFKRVGFVWISSCVVFIYFIGSAAAVVTTVFGR